MIWTRLFLCGRVKYELSSRSINQPLTFTDPTPPLYSAPPESSPACGIPRVSFMTGNTTSTHILFNSPALNARKPARTRPYHPHPSTRLSFASPDCASSFFPPCCVFARLLRHNPSCLCMVHAVQRKQLIQLCKRFNLKANGKVLSRPLHVVSTTSKASSVLTLATLTGFYSPPPLLLCSHQYIER